MTIKLNEPWEGFVVANDFVRGAGKETLELLAQPGGWIQELGSWLLFLGRPGARAAYSYHEKTSHKDWTFRGAT